MSEVIGGSEQGFTSVYLGSGAFEESDAVNGIGRQAFVRKITTYDEANGNVADAVVLTQTGLVLEVEMRSTSFDNAEALTALSTDANKDLTLGLLKTGLARL